MPLKLLAVALLAASPQGSGGPSVDQFLSAWATVGPANKDTRQGDKPEIPPELGKMLNWIEGSLQRYGREIDFAEMAGTPKRACPPPKGQREFQSEKFVPYLEALPADKRAMPVEQALYAFMDGQYPCK